MAKPIRNKNDEKKKSEKYFDLFLHYKMRRPNVNTGQFGFSAPK